MSQHAEDNQTQQRDAFHPDNDSDEGENVSQSDENDTTVSVLDEARLDILINYFHNDRTILADVLEGVIRDAVLLQTGKDGLTQAELDFIREAAADVKACLRKLPKKGSKDQVKVAMEQEIKRGIPWVLGTMQAHEEWKRDDRRARTMGV